MNAASEDVAPPVRETPYDLIGGRPAVGAMVQRFYDLMEGDPACAALRALHAPDLAPMRASLTGFLTAWLGGPLDWFEQHPGACVMSAHGKVAIDAAVSRQWTDAMRRAMADTGVAPDVARLIDDAFVRMAAAMVNRP